jgi:hypothetical protein
MREAKERVEADRAKENKRRKLMGLSLLPPETFNSEVQEMCQRLFDEVDSR